MRTSLSFLINQSLEPIIHEKELSSKEAEGECPRCNGRWCSCTFSIVQKKAFWQVQLIVQECFDVHELDSALVLLLILSSKASLVVELKVARGKLSRSNQRQTLEGRPKLTSCRERTGDTVMDSRMWGSVENHFPRRMI